MSPVYGGMTTFQRNRPPSPPSQIVGRLPRAAVAVGAVAIAMSGCSLVADATTPGEPDPIHDGSGPVNVATADSGAGVGIDDFLVLAPVKNLGLCLDPSQSMDPLVVGQSVDAVRHLVDAWALPSLDSATSGLEPTAGLSVVVRQISGGSYGDVSTQLVNGAVPAVSGLTSQPALNRDSYLDTAEVWRRARQQVEIEISEAQAKLEDVRHQLSALAVEPGDSEIAGCVSALVESFPPGTPITLVVVSDLVQSSPPQLAGDFSTVEMIVVHHCVDAATCQELRQEWEQQWSGLGLQSVSYVRPELLMTTIEGAVNGQ